MDKGCPALVPYLGARAKANGEVVLYMERHPGSITLNNFCDEFTGAFRRGCTWESEFSYPGWAGFAAGSFHYKPKAMPWALKQRLVCVVGRCAGAAEGGEAGAPQFELLKHHPGRGQRRSGARRLPRAGELDSGWQHPFHGTRQACASWEQACVPA
jgi:hypothetical protein